MFERVLYQDVNGDAIVEKLMTKGTYEIWGRDILGKYWQGERLSALIRKAESLGYEIHAKGQSVTGKYGLPTHSLHMNHLNIGNILGKFKK